MVKNKIATLDFTGQSIYCGIDVHKKNWAICIRDEVFELKIFTQPADPYLLINFLKRHYPNANYHAVYEAGFSGFSAQQILSNNGINCVVVHPADVPTTDKDAQQKTDKVDCRKLAKALCKGMIDGIYIPSVQNIDDRCLLRTRYQLVQDQTRYKNRVTAWLDFYGIKIPEGYKNSTYFTNRFIEWLEHIDLSESASLSLRAKVDAVKQIRAKLLAITGSIRQLAKTDRYEKRVEYIRSVPGIGLIGAMTILTELENIERFKTLDKLSSYVGLTPKIYSSGSTHINKGVSPRCNNTLRVILLESSWCAIRKDPALLLCYKEYLKRMIHNKAIIKIARKLLSRVRYVLLNKVKYELGVMQ